MLHKSLKIGNFLKHNQIRTFLMTYKVGVIFTMVGWFIEKLWDFVCNRPNYINLNIHVKFFISAIIDVINDQLSGMPG